MGAMVGVRSEVKGQRPHEAIQVTWFHAFGCEPCRG